ncbi:MAG: hypothetical protein H0T62_08400 [Parachlamydiaceae bacterium]|nr:hypothetical protein [Parachlamydiaceae bacterium]
MDYVSFYSPVYIELQPKESYLSLKFLVNFAEFAFNFDRSYHVTSEQFDKESLIKEKAIAQLYEKTSLAPLNLVQVIILVALAILLPIGIGLFAIKLWHHWNGFRIAPFKESEQKETFLEKIPDTPVISPSNLFEEGAIFSSYTDSTTEEQEEPVVEELVESSISDQSNLVESTRHPGPVPLPFPFIFNIESSEENIGKTAETKILHLNEEQYQLLSNEKINCQNFLDLYNLDKLVHPVTVRLDDPTDEFPFRGLLNPQTEHLRKGLRDPDFAMLAETLNLFLEKV